MKMQNVDEITSRVAEWNFNAGTQPSSDYEEREKQIQLQLSLVVEELKEFVEAAEQKDVVEAIDAVCDTMVVSSYAIVLMSWCYSQQFDYKQIGIDSIYFPLYSKEQIFDNSTLSFVRSAIKTIEQKMACDYEMKDDIVFDIVIGIGQYLYCLAIEEFGRDVVDASMEAVLATNDAKFMTAEESEAKLEQTRESYAGRFDSIVSCETPDGKFCYRSDNGSGKILKPYDWVAPDIAGIIGS